MCKVAPKDRRKTCQMPRLWVYGAHQNKIYDRGDETILTIQKSRGYSFERQICDMFANYTGGYSIRLGQPHQPDVIHTAYDTMYLIECKSTQNKYAYVNYDQITTLFEWGQKFRLYKKQYILAFKFKLSAKKSKIILYAVDQGWDYRCRHDGTLHRRYPHDIWMSVENAKELNLKI